MTDAVIQHEDGRVELRSDEGIRTSALYNHDQPTFLIDKNGFLVRPAPVGVPLPHKVSAGYVGISGEGHIKRVNVSHSFYQAFGRDDFNPIPARNNPQHINAQLAFAEAGYEKDWMEWKASGATRARPSA